MSANDHPYSDIQRDLDGQNGAEPAVRAAAHEIGCVDGASQATTRRFAVVLDDDAAVELDELVTCVQRLPDGSGDVTHYGIVVEQRGVIEGAEMPSDTRHIARERTMPGQTRTGGRCAGSPNHAGALGSARTRRRGAPRARCRGEMRLRARLDYMFPYLGAICRDTAVPYRDSANVRNERGLMSRQRTFAPRVRCVDTTHIAEGPRDESETETAPGPSGQGALAPPRLTKAGASLSPLRLPHGLLRQQVMRNHEFLVGIERKPLATGMHKNATGSVGNGDDRRRLVRPGVRFGRDRDGAGEQGRYDYRFAGSCSDLRAADARLPDPSRAGARVDAQHA